MPRLRLQATCRPRGNPSSAIPVTWWGGLSSPRPQLHLLGKHAWAAERSGPSTRKTASVPSDRVLRAEDVLYRGISRTPRCTPSIQEAERRCTGCDIRTSSTCTASPKPRAVLLSVLERCDRWASSGGGRGPFTASLGGGPRGTPASRRLYPVPCRQQVRAQQQCSPPGQRALLVVQGERLRRQKLGDLQRRAGAVQPRRRAACGRTASPMSGESQPAGTYEAERSVSAAC